MLDGYRSISINTLTTGVDSVTGGNGHDLIIAASNTLSAGDVITPAGLENTLILSGAGTFDLTAPASLTGIGLVLGDSGADQTVTLAGSKTTFIAGTGTDTISDPTGNAHIILGTGTDTVILGSGTDQIDAGAGTATLTFGSGTDTLLLEHGTGTVDVTGFGGSDLINLSHLGIFSATAYAASSTVASDGHGGTLISFTGGPSLDLIGVATVSKSDFTFSEAPTAPAPAHTPHFAHFYDHFYG